MPLLVFFLLNHPTALQCLRGCASEWGKWRAACKGRRLWPLADMHELWASQHSSGLICDRSVERASANGCVLQRMLNGRTPAQYCQGFQCWNRRRRVKVGPSWNVNFTACLFKQGVEMLEQMNTNSCAWNYTHWRKVDLYAASARHSVVGAVKLPIRLS